MEKGQDSHERIQLFHDLFLTTWHPSPPTEVQRIKMSPQNSSLVLPPFILAQRTPIFYSSTARMRGMSTIAVAWMRVNVTTTMLIVSGARTGQTTGVGDRIRTRVSSWHDSRGTNRTYLTMDLKMSRMNALPPPILPPTVGALPKLFSRRVRHFVALPSPF